MRLYLLLLITPGIVWCLQLEGTPNLALTVNEVGPKKHETLHKLLLDLTSEANLEYNFLYINCVGSIPCSQRTCESYTLQGLEESLRSRGELLVNSEISLHPSQNSHALTEARIVNAAINSADIFIVKPNFNTEVDEIIRITRKYNKRCYVVVICDNITQFKMLKARILSNDIFNIYILRPFGKSKNDLSGEKISGGSKDYKGYLMYEVCSYCRNGKNEVRLSNVWDYSKGFRNSVMFIPSFKSNFYDASIKIGLKHPNSVWCFAVGLTADGKTKWGGREYWLAQTIAKYLNFKMEIVNADDGIICAAVNSTMKGLCKLLLDGKVKMTGFGAAILSWRFQYMEPSSVYLITRNRIFSASPPLIPQSMSLFGSIDRYVMIFLLVSYIALTLTLWRAKKYYTPEDKNTFQDSALCLLSFLFFESTNFTGNRLKFSEMLIIGVWSISCLFAISGIFGEMTSSSISKPKPVDKPIDNFDDMAAAGASWITPLSYKSPEYLPRKKLPHLIHKSKKMSAKDGIAYVLKYPRKYVYYFVKPGLILVIRSHFWDGTGASPIHIGSDSEDPPYPVAVLLAKGSPYTEAVTKATLLIEAAGLYLHKFVPDTLDLYTKSSKPVKTTADADEQKYFTLEKMTSALVPYGLGSALSLLVLGGEFVLFRIRKKTHT